MAFEETMNSARVSSGAGGRSQWLFYGSKSTVYGRYSCAFELSSRR